MYIKILRKNLGYTQQYVANVIGVDSSTVAKWETGKAYPTVDKLIQLSRLFNCSVDELLGLSETKELKNA